MRWVSPAIYNTIRRTSTNPMKITDAHTFIMRKQMIACKLYMYMYIYIPQMNIIKSDLRLTELDHSTAIQKACSSSASVETK